MKLTGAKVVLNCLKEQGVDTIFGYPGGTVLPIYDALYSEKGVTHILTAHEQGATHAADGYARATGKVGVVLVTSGPGATNTVTGIANAYRDSVPIVVLTGQVSLNLLERDSFQEVDIVSITKKITKKNYLVKEVDKLADTLREAFDLARSGRPGPVLVDIPKDIQTAVTEYNHEEAELFYKPYNRYDDCAYDIELEENLEKAIEAIKNSERPLIYAGGGINISGANGELEIFAEKIKAPVTCSLMALGAFPSTHPYFTGMVGMHGTRCSNYAVKKCDLLIAIGSRFSDRVTSNRDNFASQAKVIHIDIDPIEIGKNIHADIPICGDVKKILSIFNDRISEKEETEWNQQITEWKEKFPLRCKDNSGVNPQKIVQTLSRLLKGNGIVTTEVGQNQIWTAQYFNFDRPRSLITSGGLGTMGFGLGAAIGACVANTGSRVVNIAGDGSFKMNSNELATISKYKLPIIQLVFNNHALGMVRQWQDLFYEGRFSQTKFGEEVDFVKLAEAYGIKGIRVRDNDSIETVLKEALDLMEPVLIDFDIHSDDKVFPIVAPGASIDNIIESA